MFHLLLCEEQAPELVGLADTKQEVMLWIARYRKLVRRVSRFYKGVPEVRYNDAG